MATATSRGGLWQRVQDWNIGGGGNSDSKGQNMTTHLHHSSSSSNNAAAVSFATSRNRNCSFYSQGGEGQSRIPHRSSQPVEDDGSSSSSSTDDSHRSLLTSRSNNSHSPLNGVFARTSSSVSSLKDQQLAHRQSSNSLASMAAIHQDRTNERALLVYGAAAAAADDGRSTCSSCKHNKSGASNRSNNSHRKRSKPWPAVLYLRHRASATNVSALIMGLLLCVLAFHRLLSLYMNHRRWLNAPITYLHRQCPAPEYPVMSSILTSTTIASEQLPEAVKAEQETHAESKSRTSPATTPVAAAAAAAAAAPSICLVTFTDSQSPSLIQRLVRWRNYAGILELTWPNKLAYASKHNYQLFDHSRYLDTSRPPAWSKIPAMQALLEQPPPSASGGTSGNDSASSKSNDKNTDDDNHHAACDWVVWTDADTVIMNSNIRITDFLPAADSGLNLVVASDEGGGYNSGVLLLRNTDWSRKFLQTWWDMTSYVRPPGFSLSGDNAAMKALLRDMADFDSHVAVPPRCTMNSFARFLTIRESKHVMETLEEQEWYMNERFYHKSDFIAHAPGYDNKAECIRLLLQEAE